MRHYKIIAVLLCCVLLVACSGDDDAKQGSRFDPDSPEGKGEQVFRENCATCHSVESDRVVVGPSLAGIATRAGERVEDLTGPEYIRQSIMQPNAYVVEGFPGGAMPQNFARVLTGEQLDNLVAYLLTLE